MKIALIISMVFAQTFICAQEANKYKVVLQSAHVTKNKNYLKNADSIVDFQVCLEVTRTDGIVMSDQFYVKPTLVNVIGTNNESLAEKSDGGFSMMGSYPFLYNFDNIKYPKDRKIVLFEGVIHFPVKEVTETICLTNLSELVNKESESAILRDIGFKILKVGKQKVSFTGRDKIRILLLTNPNNEKYFPETYSSSQNIYFFKTQKLIESTDILSLTVVKTQETVDLPFKFENIELP